MMNGFLRGVVTLVIDVLLVVMSNAAVEFLIRIAGIAFLLPAVASLVNLYISRDEMKGLPSVLIAVVDLGSMAFGMWLLVSPLSFQTLFVRMMALLLFVVALHQIFVLISLRRKSKLYWKMCILPLILLSIAIYLFFQTQAAVSLMAIVLGVCAISSALYDIFIAIMLRKVRGNDIVVLPEETDNSSEFE